MRISYHSMLRKVGFYPYKSRGIPHLHGVVTKEISMHAPHLANTISQYAEKGGVPTSSIRGVCPHPCIPPPTLGMAGAVSG